MESTNPSLPSPKGSRVNPTMIAAIVLVTIGFWTVVIGFLLPSGTPPGAAAGRPEGLPPAPRATKGDIPSALRHIVSAEKLLRDRDLDENLASDFWTADVSGLRQLAPKGAPLNLIDREIAAADANPEVDPRYPRIPLDGLRPWSGYRFIAMQEYGRRQRYDVKAGRNPSRFAVCAYPDPYGGPAKLTYIVSEAEIVWRKDSGGNQVLAWPIDPAAEGWTKVE